MTECPVLTNRVENELFITKDNMFDLIIDNYNRSPGSIVSLTCADGITLVGESRVTCLATGQWNYGTKPHCTVDASTPVSEESDLPTILVGVVCAVAGVIIVVLAVMLFVVYRRDKQFRQSQASTQSMISKSGQDREPPAPYNQYYESGKGREPPAPYDQHYDSFSRNSDHYGRPGPRRYERKLERDLESQLSNSMYLPRDQSGDWREHFGNDSRTEFYRGIDRPRVKSWVSRGPMYGDNRMPMPDYREEPQFRRDPLLWRNAVLY